MRSQNQKINKHLPVLIALLGFGLVGCMSPQAKDATIRGFNDYELCTAYFSKLWASARSQEHRYSNYKLIVAEVDRRNLDCRYFPEFKDSEDFIRERIRLFEEEGSW